MTGLQAKAIKIIAACILVMVLVIVGVGLLNKNSSEPPMAPATTTSDKTPETTPVASSTEIDAPAATPVEDDIPAVDPASLSFVDIEPLALAVAYTKGTPGFEFVVKRTADQTQYIEFTSPELIGTKCTDDTGLIASIIKNPTSSEDQTTIKQTVKVGDDSYGLSLTSSSCTKNSELLEEYQKAFRAGFSSLVSL